MIKKIATFLTIGLTLPFTASAHVKWFVDTDEILQHQTSSFGITEPRVLVWIGIVICVLVAAFFLERKTPEPSIYFRRAIKRNESKFLWFFQLVVGIGLVIGAASGHIIAPTFEVTSNWLITLQVTQAIIGALFILNIFVITASWALILLYGITAFHFGWLPLLEHLLILGIAIYLLFEKANTTKEEKRVWDPYRTYGLPLLRITTGISLVVLAFQEKLLHPDLGLRFLAEHNLNFMHTLGLEWFSNELFVLSAGMCELLLGLLLITGLLTRISTLVLTLFLIATAIALGIPEITGHIIMLGITFILMVYGAGKTLALRTPPKI